MRRLYSNQHHDFIASCIVPFDSEVLLEISVINHTLALESTIEEA